MKYGSCSSAWVLVWGEQSAKEIENSLDKREGPIMGLSKREKKEPTSAWLDTWVPGSHLTTCK